jgi:hypothetical protein
MWSTKGVGHSYKFVASNMDVMISAVRKCKNNFNYFFTGYIIINYPSRVVTSVETDETYLVAMPLDVP